jgi:signal transduction histidine kinase
MASARGESGRGSVGRRLAASVAVNFFVLLVVGAAGIAGTVRAHESVGFVADRVQPEALEVAAALQDLTEAESAVWSYSISGERDALAQYRAARARFRDRRIRLERLGQFDFRVSVLVDDFLSAGDRWFRRYAEPRVNGPVGLATFDVGRFDRARALFAEVRSSNAAVGQRLAELTETAHESADRVHRTLVGLLAAVLAAGAAGSLLVARRAGRGVTEPLGALEETARRLAAGDHAARAPVEGPREVVQVASAINAMADENDRAREVEAHVVDRLRTLDAVKSDFVSNVSHELRTPLTSIVGYLELLEDELEGRATESDRDLVRAASRNVARLGDLVDDLLALTRTESRRADLVPVDLSGLAHDVVTDLRVASTQRGVDIRLAVPDQPVPVLGDAGQLARVLTNLVSNAVKFSPAASEVTVAVVTESRHAVLSVEDHGIGIPSGELDQLGSRFYRASNAVGLGITGTGLGLRIVQAIVDHHHGSLDLHSQEGVGTTVTVRLPLLASAEPGRPEPDAEVASSASVR